MIEFVTGNLLQADTEALINTVNAAAVMGKGIALQFKEQFPANFKTYEEACKKGLVKTGEMLVARNVSLTGW
ncbi:MAG: macro domain-containing protein [Chitinophagales bacterium]